MLHQAQNERWNFFWIAKDLMFPQVDSDDCDCLWIANDQRPHQADGEDRLSLDIQ